MVTPEAVPELSVILEWENVLLSGDTRCFAMLAELRRQLDALRRTAELLVLFNPKQVARVEVESAIQDHFLANAADSRVLLRLEEAPDRHYYQLKNEGAARARGPVLVLADTDILPEAGWLKALVQPLLDHPEIGAVAGNTYLAHGSVYEKAFALGWFFPLREPEDVLQPDATRLFANNVAIRREILLRHPFPDMPAGTSRGACLELTAALIADGIPIWSNTAARTSHPPPADLHHFIARGIAHGRDITLQHMGRGGSRLAGTARSLAWSLWQLAKATRRLARDRRKVDLALWQLPLAWVIMSGFYGVASIGGLVACMAPEYARTHWQV